jgi:hypothetical protein
VNYTLFESERDAVPRPGDLLVFHRKHSAVAMGEIISAILIIERGIVFDVFVLLSSGGVMVRKECELRRGDTPNYRVWFQMIETQDIEEGCETTLMNFIRGEL